MKRIWFYTWAYWWAKFLSGFLGVVTFGMVSRFWEQKAIKKLAKVKVDYAKEKRI